MKRVVILFLTCTLLIALVACSNDGTEKEKGKDKKKPNTVEQEDKEAGTKDNRPKKDRVLGEIEARFHAEGENGFSIWSVSGMDYEEKKYCVDYEGYKTFDFDEGEEELSDVYSGVVLTMIDDTYRVRRATDGKILYSTEKSPEVTIMVPYYNEHKFLEDGFIFAYTKKESYNQTTYEIGFLGKDGEWIVPLSSSNPILATIGDKASVEYLNESLVYSDEGMIAFKVDTKHYLYSIDQNKVKEIVPTAHFTDSNIREIISCGIDFNDGYATGLFDFGSRFYKLSTSGAITEIPLNYHEKLHEEEGKTYYDAKNNKAIVAGYTYHTDTFSVFDSKGTIINTLENVTVSNMNGFFDNGYAQIVFENQDSTMFYSVLGVDGKLLFDPIALGVTEVLDMEGHVIECVESYAVNQGTYAVVDHSGKVLLETEFVYNFSINNGVARYRTEFDGDYEYKSLVD